MQAFLAKAIQNCGELPWRSTFRSLSLVLHGSVLHQIHRRVVQKCVCVERRLSTSTTPLLHSQHPRLPTSWGHLGCLHGPKDFKIVPKSCPRNLPGHPNAPTDCAKTPERRPSVSPRIWATGRSGDCSSDWSHNLVLVCRLRAIGWHFDATGACTVSSTSRSLLHVVHPPA